jgi:cytidine deaminase
LVAVRDRDGDVIAPCGRCRQVLLDQQPECQVIVPSQSDETIVVPVRWLLPFSYNHPDADPERLIRLDSRYYDNVASGAKTATTRFDDPCAPGTAWLVLEFDDEYRRLRGAVDSITTKRFEDDAP